MGKRSRTINRAHGRHKLPGESKKEFARRTNNGQNVRPPDDLVLKGRISPVPAPPINPPFTEPSPVLTEEQVGFAQGREYNPWHDRSLTELKKVAAEAEVPGRSKMNKGDLAEALHQLGYIPS
jgi:hypothetical protein